MSDKLIAKRRLFNINFEAEGSHVALVGKHQGGAANGHTVLLTKATKNLPKVVPGDLAIVNKALEQVSVKLSMEEFLRKFFDMWHSDAELLTKLLGFETEYENATNQLSGDGKGYTTHQEYLEGKLSGITLMKSLHEGTLETLTGADYLTIVKYQQKFETNGDLMKENDQEVNVVKAALEKSKGEVTALQKSLTETEGKLTVALAEVETLKAAGQVAVQKAREDKLKQVLAEDQVEKTLESLKSLDDASFDFVVENFQKARDAAEGTFVEKGVDAEIQDDLPEDSNPVMQLIKAKKQNKAK